MADVTIYTRQFCPYCSRAVALLKEKNVAFEEIDAGMDAEKKAEMIERANGGRTFPQIFIVLTKTYAGTPSNCHLMHSFIFVPTFLTDPGDGVDLHPDLIY